MSSVMVLASDVPLEAFVSSSEKPLVLSEDAGGSTVSIRFEDDFAVWPSDGYLEIPTQKEYFADLAIYNPDCGDKVAEYLKNLLKTAHELELWHVWLDGDMDHRVRKAEIKADELTAEDIRELNALETWREPVIYYCYQITQ